MYGDDNYQRLMADRRSWYPIICLILGWRWI